MQSYYTITVTYKPQNGRDIGVQDIAQRHHSHAASVPNYENLRTGKPMKIGFTFSEADVVGFVRDCLPVKGLDAILIKPSNKR